MCCLVKFFVGLVYRCNFDVTVVESLVVQLAGNVRNLEYKLCVLVCKTQEQMGKWNVMYKLLKDL